MQIDFKGLCRNNGKIYIKTEAKHLQTGSSLEIRCIAKNGFELPCRIYGFEEKSDLIAYVVVLPDMPGRATLVFSEVGPDGMLIGEPIKKSLSSFLSKWESRLNYKVNKSLTKQIRGYDDRAQYDRIHIDFWEVIPLDDKKFRVRIELELPYEENAEIELQCFNNDLQLVETDFMFLGEDLRSPAWKRSAVFRVQKYSIVLDDKYSHYLFTATDLDHSGLDGFAVLKPKRCKEMMHDWAQVHEAILNEPYEEWFESHQATRADLKLQSSTHLKHEPLFSIVVPLFKTPINLFEEMVDSVVQQSYSKWELILVNASPEDEQLCSHISNRVIRDDRIKAITLEDNLGISLNTRAGIDQAQGEFICFLDHDDIIEPDTLFTYATAINEDPAIDLLYCDEDKLLPNGKFDMPFFKPDFSIDLLRNVNYVCHFLCVKKSVIDSIELYTAEVDGAQDHDLTLKVAERSDHIHHVPRMLYHWRICEGSTAQGADSKPYAIQAGIKAVQSHLDRLGIRAKVTPNDIPFSYDVEYLVDDIEPLISIIIPSKDESKTLSDCIDSIIEKSTYSNYEIIVVENNSEEAETFAYYDEIVEQHKNVRIEKWAAEFNFSKLVNFGAEKAHGEYLVFLNNDTEVITNDWLEKMLGVCRRPEVGVVGVRLWYPDETIQHAGVAMTPRGPIHVNYGFPRGRYGYFNLADKPHAVSAVTAACIMVRKKLYDEIGGFDESFAIAYNDVDFCLRICELGKLVVYLPSVELYHYESLSRGTDKSNDKKIRLGEEDALLRQRWMKYYVLGDPFLRPTLMLG